MPTSEDRIAAQYAEAEGQLLALIAAAVAAGLDRRADTYRAGLRALRGLHNAAGRVLDGVEAGLLSEVGGAMVTAYDQGVGQAVRTIPGEVIRPENPVTMLTMEVEQALRSQRATVLRSVDDAYRQVVQQVTTRAVISGANIDKVVQQALDRFADRGVTAFVDSRGRKYGMDTYTRMALRTARNRAMNEGRADAFQANGINLIQTSSHPDPAPMCEPYQGRILSLDGVAGTRTITDRATGRDITVEVVATREEALANGWRHPNCRHVESAYIPGAALPIVPEVDPAAYEATQRQRQIERHIRAWKKREAVALDPQAKAQAKARVRAWQKAQRAHVARHDHLRRNYSREKLWTP